MSVVCVGKGAENLFPFLFSFPFFFSSRHEPLPVVVDATANPRIRGGYGLRVPSTPNTPIAAAPRYLPRIITANKGKKWNVLDSGNVTSAFSLPKYRSGFPLPAYRIFRDVYPNFLPSVYIAFLDSTIIFSINLFLIA